MAILKYNSMTFKKLFLSFTLLSVVFDLSAQLKMIKTGRPQSFEYNNAERTVGKRWGIEFDYLAFDGVNFDLLDSITAQNQVTEAKIAAKKGANWNTVFRAEVETELKKQNDLRSQIMSQIQDQPPFPIMIHFEQSKWSRHKYKAYAFSLVISEETCYQVNQQYKVNLKTNKISLKSEKIKNLHFEYPENGITS